MEDIQGVDEFMGPVAEAISRHIERKSDAWIDIYNRAWEAVNNALSSKKVKSGMNPSKIGRKKR